MDPGQQTVRTLFIHTPTEPPLGADVWVHAQIMRWLDRGSHCVHLALSPGDPGRPTPLERQVAGVDHLARFALDPGPRRPAGRSTRAVARLVRESVLWLRSLVELGRYVRRNDIDVLHTCDRPRDAVATVVLGRVCRIPSIVHVHVPYGDWMSRPRRWAISAATHRIAVSDFIRASLIEVGCPADRTHTILNGVDLQRWVPDPQAGAVREEFGIPLDAPIVLSVCRLFEAKGALELVDAFAAADVPAAYLMIAGEDSSETQEYRQRLEARIAELGLGERTVLAGWRDDVPALMTAADVFAMPSTGEPCALVYLEAMAMGLPVIALDDGGTPELVVHGHQGLLSTYGDQGALAANLRRLLKDEGLRREMAGSGRARVAERFTTTRQAIDVAELYRVVILAGSAGRDRR
jgi:glycosyltransferase involved in cell wall biosynthesis